MVAGVVVEATGVIDVSGGGGGCLAAAISLFISGVLLVHSALMCTCQYYQIIDGPVKSVFEPRFDRDNSNRNML